jgi:hypothetical protein
MQTHFSSLLFMFIQSPEIFQSPPSLLSLNHMVTPHHTAPYSSGFTNQTFTSHCQIFIQGLLKLHQTHLTVKVTNEMFHETRNL